ncbi:hypothetical protein SEA_ZUKO_41 [Streptomyces phage Zuko]|uniref:Uncharacterized protein n=1 Tax=Streptomyces phage Zuko TaxID=2601695 RepID=A0A5J6D747_9CAUD|nr:hypothetical protein PP630_gp041 [Streptomyces phage Zuko]QEQ93619.1 hypothetical protein SEA_ZUKO_41 [Streptomyces phage Zuko]
MRVKISDGVREVEVEGEGSLAEFESAAQRLYQVVAPTDNNGKRPAGFTGNGWSTLSDHERDPEA